MSRASAAAMTKARERFAVELPPLGFFPPPPADRQLPMWTSSIAAADETAALWWFLGVHGAAGASTLVRYSRTTGEAFANDARGYWPDPQLERSPYVVLVARTHMHGLMRAQDVLRQYLASHAPAATRVLGLVLVADAPGHLPKPLASSRQLVSGLAPRTWHVPYVPEYRLSSPLLSDDRWPPCHPDVADVLSDIRSTIRGGTP
jgi:hypothetical protein